MKIADLRNALKTIKVTHTQADVVNALYALGLDLDAVTIEHVTSIADKINEMKSKVTLATTDQKPTGLVTSYDAGSIARPNVEDITPQMSSEYAEFLEFRRMKQAQAMIDQGVAYEEAMTDTIHEQAHTPENQAKILNSKIRRMQVMNLIHGNEAYLEYRSRIMY
ncbi:hypothetical protein [Chroococcidiopsis sp.]|uniref:hypothetical protein n=1 Tax=Chroococcidiopsis sp. TaxID=3088168 RepID=UPI003F31021C